jgi:catechol 2,3-dioxygenase-like lactoylglutathione lyase family enzyme
MTSLRHVGIVVADLERALGFYRDLLGLEAARAMDEHGEFLDAILGAERAAVRTVKLGGKSGAQIELLQFTRPPLDQGPPPGVTRRGPTHVALNVEGIDALYERLAVAGVRFTTAPRLSPDGRAKVTFCHDPDGTLIELVELVPA